MQLLRLLPLVPSRTFMAKTKSSRQWLDRHFNDIYVKRAQHEGYRSRAAYKLLELQERDHLLRPGMRVVDLGAAPGSWSQVAQRLVGPFGGVVALDLLPVDPIAGVEVIRGDFREEKPLRALQAALGDLPLDLVLSDMAPNTSGIGAVDQPRALYLAELATAFARDHLSPGGALVVKVFQGQGFDGLLRELRSAFGRVVSRKPRASRPESREVYLVATSYKVV